MGHAEAQINAFVSSKLDYLASLPCVYVILVLLTFFI